MSGCYKSNLFEKSSDANEIGRALFGLDRLGSVCRLRRDMNDFRIDSTFPSESSFFSLSPHFVEHDDGDGDGDGDGDA